jgi:hypothetical protein
MKLSWYFLVVHHKRDGGTLKLGLDARLEAHSLECIAFWIFSIPQVKLKVITLKFCIERRRNRRLEFSANGIGG